MNLKFDLQLTRKQKEAYDILMDKGTRQLTCCWSRQCGKSVFCEMIVIQYLFTSPRGFIAYITPSYVLARKVYKEILSLIEGNDYIKSSNATTLTIEMANGCTLQFFSNEAYKSLRGQTVKTLLVIDECAFFQEMLPSGEDFFNNILLPVTKAYHPKVLIVSTPQGKQGWFYQQYLDGLDATKRSKRTLKATIYDDDLISEEEINEIKDAISPLAFRQEYMVEFLTSALTVFENYEEQFIDYQQVTEIDYSKAIGWIGVDLSSVGEDNTILTFIDTNGKTRQELIDGTLDEKYNKIANIINGCPNLIECYIEANGVGSPMINEIKKLLWRNKGKVKEWQTTNESKNEIIAMLANDIVHEKIWFSKENTMLFGEMGVFTYTISKSKKLCFAAKAGKHDDTVMSLAIANKCRDDFKWNGNTVSSTSRFVGIKNRYHSVR